MEKIIIKQGKTYYKPNFLGFLSPNWRILGAYRRGKFNRFVEFKTFWELPTIKDWTFKNGKQKWYIVDLNYSTRRIWMYPVEVWMSKVGEFLKNRRL